MGKAFVVIPPELLAKSLHLGETEIYGAEWSFSSNCIHLYISSNKLPDLIEGQSLKRVGYRIKMFDNGGFLIKWNGEEEV